MKRVKMVEGFSNSNKDSNFIEGTKIMENFSDNNETGSSIFQGKIREQDFSAEQKLNELRAAIEELDRQDLLRRLECERQASSCVDETSSQAELHIGEGDDEDYFNGKRERVLGDFWNFFEPLFNLFEVDLDPKDYQMLKEKKEKNLIAAIMKFLRDKLKKLIKKIFTSNLDLSWDKRLDKEIKELQEKLGSGELSEEEFARVFERLQFLQDLKFKLQLAVTGWIITMFAEMFGVELAAIVEASTEETAKAEDKKAERTSLKEENKEVCENVEMKVDEREKPKVPVSLFEVSPGFVRPVPLSKPELDLLPKPMKELMPKEVIKEEIREIKETKPKVEEEKKAKPEPKKEVCPPKPAEQPVKKEPVIFRDARRSSERGKWSNDASGRETPTIGSSDRRNIGNSGNIGKETVESIDIDKICGELLTEQEVSQKLNSVNIEPKESYKGK
ncbi:hypothetical protein [Wolbachia endosymbiont (group A) of Ectemnius continuus]|uniref:hypothetical protein n=1 Tax=Wolbachia endosymbiont (group A) of Ectemnius continuus TaxID=2954002 RepID=UPI002232356B|nr:hypothetical protein [Wolbachia endosymbiont (group A) of Ectemnius continuus]